MNTFQISTFIGQINSKPIQLVSARELHQRLQVGKMFAHWIKDRIAQYGFVEGEDFLPISAKSDFGRPSVEYHITLNMAKELCMLERSVLGNP